MILTVTIDPVLERIYYIEEWVAGDSLQAEKERICVGGKGLAISVALRHLGQNGLGLCFLAGATGQLLLKTLQDYGVVVDAVWVDGETRQATAVAERKHSRRTLLYSNRMSVHTSRFEDFALRLREDLLQADWLCAGGSYLRDLPPRFYTWLIKEARASGVPVLLDAFGPTLRSALDARPDIVKMNWKEFEWTANQAYLRVDQLCEAAAAFYREQGLNALVITCGADGILVFTPHGQYHARPPVQAEINAAGAGEAASAALVWRLSEGDEWPAALRWAAAASAASVLTEGTADLLLQDVNRLLPRVEVESLKLPVRT